MTEKQIVWYILLTEVKIDSDTQSVTSLSVAPLAVLPEFQRKGIGGGCPKTYWDIKQIALVNFYFFYYSCLTLYIIETQLFCLYL